MRDREAWFALGERPAWRGLAAVAVVAVLLRAGLAISVSSGLGCTLESYARSADGSQFLAMARGWLGDAGAVRNEIFFQMLTENGPLSSSHLIRFMPAMPGTIALSMAAGMPFGLAATLPFWLLSGAAAALAAAWARDLRVGLAVALMPPIQLYASSLPAYEPWFYLTTIGAVWSAERDRWFFSGTLLGLAAWDRPEALFAAFCVAWIGLRKRELRPTLVAATAALGMTVVGALLVFWRFEPVLGDLWLRSATPSGAGVGFLTWPGAALVGAILEDSRPGWKLPYVLAHVAAAIVATAALAARLSRHEKSERRDCQPLLVWLSGHLLFVLSLSGTQGFDDVPRYLGLVAPIVAYAWLPLLPHRRWVWSLIGAVSVCVAYLPAAKNARPECRSSQREVSTQQTREAHRAPDQAREIGSLSVHRPRRSGSRSGPIESSGAPTLNGYEEMLPVSVASCGGWSHTYEPISGSSGHIFETPLFGLASREIRIGS